VNGAGVLVGVVDTGIDDPLHESLRGTVLTGASYTLLDTECVNPSDGHASRHGTGTSGIAGGRGAGSTSDTQGVARTVMFMDIRVESQDDAGSVDIKAFDFVTRWNKRQVPLDCGVPWQPIRVINWSRSPFSDDCGQSTLASTIQAAMAQGVVVVKSARNGGPSANTLGGATPDGIINVAAIDDRSTVDRADDYLAEFSSRGPRCSDGDADTLDELMPILAAPGVNILRPMTLCSEPDCFAYYQSSSGTSFSAPAVAGVVALMLEIKPCLAPTSATDFRVRNLLINSTEYRTEVQTTPLQHSQTGYFGRTWNNGWGYGYVDAHQAVNLAQQTTC
jgi:serine protease AprX